MTVWDLFVENLKVLPVAALAGWLGKVWADRIARKEQAKISSELSEQKNSFAHQLESIQQSNRRDLINAELYYTKRHEKYPEVYRQVQIAYGKVSGLYGLRYKTGWENYDQDDFEKYFGEIGYTEKLKKEFFKKYNVNKDDAIRELEKFLRNSEFGEIQEVHRNAQNLRLLDSLYFSEITLKLLDEVLNKIHSVYVNYSLVHFHDAGDELYEKGSDGVKELPPFIEKLEKQMRSEMIKMDVMEF